LTMNDFEQLLYKDAFIKNLKLNEWEIYRMVKLNY
jgi:hypothetical protein